MDSCTGTWNYEPGGAMPAQLIPHISAAVWDEFLTQLTTSVIDARTIVTCGRLVLLLLLVVIAIAVLYFTVPDFSWTPLLVGFLIYAYFQGIQQNRQKAAEENVVEEWKPRFATAGLTITREHRSVKNGDSHASNYTWLEINTPAPAAEQTMQVQVPANALPGSIVQFMGPGGNKVEIVVPPNAVPGTVLEINILPANKT